MSVIIRKAKEKYGKRIKVVNFADDFIAFSKNKEKNNEHINMEQHHHWPSRCRL